MKSSKLTKLHSHFCVLVRSLNSSILIQYQDFWKQKK